MTATAVDREAKFYPEGREFSYPAAVEKIPEGTFVALNTSTGYACKATNAASRLLLGVAVAPCDNSGGSAGDLSVRVARRGIFAFVCAGLGATDAGCDLYVADNQTVTKTPGYLYAGKLVRYTSATEAFCDISRAVGEPVIYDAGQLVLLPAAATANIAAGDMVCYNATGYITNAGLTTAGFRLAGTAAAACNNAAGLDGAKDVLVQRNGVRTLVTSGAALTDNGAPVWIADKNTVTLTPGNVRAGQVAKYNAATSVDVDISEGCNWGKNPSRNKCITFQAAADLTVHSALEFPTKIKINRMYMHLGTAPGGADTETFTFTDGTTTKTLVATGAAVVAEDEAVDAVILANTNCTVSFVRTGSTAANIAAVVEYEEL